MEIRPPRARIKIGALACNAGTEPLKGGHTLGTFFVSKYDTSQVEKFD